MKFGTLALKVIGIVLSIIGGLLLLYALFQFLCAPVYDFPEKQSFSGKYFYNPYQGCYDTWWRKAVFHKHADGWGGMGFKKNETKATFERYKYLGYDIVALSDYQHINASVYEKQTEAIPNYEHGWGMKKNHHLSIGARSVLPFDFLFPQTTSNKQFIINQLRKRTDVLALAHPDWNHAYDEDDMKQLCDYDCFEIFSNYHSSLNLWDSTLSAGMPVFLLADDDNDKINNPDVVGRCLTLVNSWNTSRQAVTNALKQGRTIGVRVFSLDNEPWTIKKKNIEAIPVLEKLMVKKDTLRLTLSRLAKAIRFIGQNGIVMKKDSNTSVSYYPFNNTDTYIRTEIEFFTGTTFYLNPVIRYNGIGFYHYHAHVNLFLTLLKISLMVAAVVFVFFYYYRKRKHRSRSKRNLNRVRFGF
jgi:hypothetical protein